MARYLTCQHTLLVEDNLQKGGLVRPERSPEDRRLVVVSLAEAGRALIKDVFPDHVAETVEEMGALTAKGQQMPGRL